MESRKLRYVTKDGVKFTTWKYSTCEYCFYLDKKTDIVKTLLLSDPERICQKHIKTSKAKVLAR